jgi:hypothetical protein
MKASSTISANTLYFYFVSKAQNTSYGVSTLNELGESQADAPPWNLYTPEL